MKHTLSLFAIAILSISSVAQAQVLQPDIKSQSVAHYQDMMNKELAEKINSGFNFDTKKDFDVDNEVSTPPSNLRLSNTFITSTVTCKSKTIQVENFDGLLNTLIDLDVQYRDNLRNALGVLPQVNSIAYRTFMSDESVKQYLTEESLKNDSIYFGKDFGKEARLSAWIVLSGKKSDLVSFQFCIW